MGQSDKWSLRDYFDWYSFRVLEHLPIAWVSGIGAAAAWAFTIYVTYRDLSWWKHMLKTITEITGDTNYKRLHQTRVKSIENIGRIMVEYAINKRVLDTSRLRISGVENLQNLKSPTVFVGAHVGNWETAGIALLRNGIPFVGVYEPAQLASHRKIAQITRQQLMSRIRGARLMATSRTTARELAQAVDGGENLLIYVDEYVDDLVWCPALGRQLPATGNRILAARLALRAGGDVVPVRTRRGAGTTFEVTIESPLRFEPTGDKKHDARVLGDAISSAVESWVLEDIDQWYQLPYLIMGKPFSKSSGKTFPANSNVAEPKK